jgi:hypothetical protein
MKKEGCKMSKDRIDSFLYEKKGEYLDQVKEIAMADTEILNEILQGLKSKNEIFRYNCYKVIFQISKTHSQLLYPKWDYFFDLLESPNAYHRMSAINIISYLTSADTGKKFDLVFDRYFQFLDDGSMIVARYLALSAGIIAKNKPYLAEKIMEKLLEIENTHHEEGRKDLIKHDIIQSFSVLFEQIAEKEKTLSFVEKQLNSSSPKTRKTAKAFLNKFRKSNL